MSADLLNPKREEKSVSRRRLKGFDPVFDRNHLFPIEALCISVDHREELQRISGSDEQKKGNIFFLFPAMAFSSARQENINQTAIEH